MVYYSKMSEEVGAVLCRGMTGNMRPQRGFLPASAEEFARHGAGRANAEGEKGLLVPEPEKAAGAVFGFWEAWSLHSIQCFSTAAAMGATPREPRGLSAQSLSNPRAEPLGWVGRDREL